MLLMLANRDITTALTIRLRSIRLGLYVTRVHSIRVGRVRRNSNSSSTSNGLQDFYYSGDFGLHFFLLIEETRLPDFRPAFDIVTRGARGGFVLLDAEHDSER